MWAGTTDSALDGAGLLSSSVAQEATVAGRDV